MSHLENGWDGDDGPRRTGEFVDAYSRYWDDHNAVFRVRNLKAEEGDSAFRKARSKANLVVIEAMSAMVRQGQDAGRLPKNIHPYVTGTAMIAMIERLLPYQDVESAPRTAASPANASPTRSRPSSTRRSPAARSNTPGAHRTQGDTSWSASRCVTTCAGRRGRPRTARSTRR